MTISRLHQGSLASLRFASLRSPLEHLRRAGSLLRQSVLELRGQTPVGGLPRLVRALPRVVGRLVLGLHPIEELPGVGADVPLLLGQAEALPGTVNVGDASLSVGSVGSLRRAKKVRRRCEEGAKTNTN